MSLPAKPNRPPTSPKTAAISTSIKLAAANTVNMYPDIKEIFESKSRIIFELICLRNNLLY